MDNPVDRFIFIGLIFIILITIISYKLTRRRSAAAIKTAYQLLEHISPKNKRITTAPPSILSPQTFKLPNGLNLLFAIVLSTDVLVVYFLAQTGISKEKMAIIIVAILLFSLNCTFLVYMFIANGRHLLEIKPKVIRAKKRRHRKL